LLRPGVAEFRMAEFADGMIERRDRALYQAKRAGRNCVFKEAVADEEIAARFSLERAPPVSAQIASATFSRPIRRASERTSRFWSSRS
jgi:hypothetical protein